MNELFLPVIIPARNEKDYLKDTVSKLRRSAKYANINLEIVVVDDGSTDGTEKIAQLLDCHVFILRDRGYSALGTPELAKTHNEGFKYITNPLFIKQNFAYVLILGADTKLEEDYLKILLNELDNDDKLVATAGMINGIKSSPGAISGSGRIYRYSFLEQMQIFGVDYSSYEQIVNELEIDFQYDDYYSWETYPLFYAQYSDYHVKQIPEAKMYSRKTTLRVNWKYYGIGMYEGGFIFVYVLGRAFKLIIKLRIKNAFQLLYGWIKSHFVREKRYPKYVRKYIKRYQYKRILRALTFGRLAM